MANFSVEWLSKSYYALHSEVQSEMEEFTKGSRSQSSPTSPNNSCGDSSGCESEVGDDSEGEVTLLQRRMRTKFTSEQIIKLENAFSKHRYLGAMQRRKIAEKLDLSETQVKTWFQNRRMKLKREVQDHLRPGFLSVPASLLPPPPPLLFQHPVLSGQLPVLSGQLPVLSGQFPPAPSFYPQLQPLHSSTLPAALQQQHRSHLHLHLHPAIMPPPHFY